MRIAVIADIHGNALALEAVLADIATRNVDQVINLGDIVSGPLWPRETMELLSGRDWLTVRGNHDRWVAENDAANMGASDRLAVARLDIGHRHWLGALPMVAACGHGIVAFHAMPADDNSYLIEEVWRGHLVRGPLEGIRRRLGETDARIVLCGHSHNPHVLQLPDGPLLVNPGSVGAPAYDDPTGDAHVSEAGAPHARYAVLDLGGARPGVEMIALDYAWETAAREAEKNGRPEWAHALRTGFMPDAG